MYNVDISRLNHIELPSTFRDRLRRAVRSGPNWEAFHLEFPDYVSSGATRDALVSAAVAAGVDVEGLYRDYLAWAERTGPKKSRPKHNGKMIEACALLHRLGYRWADTTHKWLKTEEW